MATNPDLVEAKHVTRKEKRFFLKASVREADGKHTHVHSCRYSCTHINKTCLSIGGRHYCGEYVLSLP